MANKKRKDKYDWWAAIVFWVIVIGFFLAILYSSMNRTEYVCIPVEESITYHSSESFGQLPAIVNQQLPGGTEIVEGIGQIPEEVATILPGKEFVDYDWEAFLSNSQTADLSSIYVGGGVISTVIIGLAGWNLKETNKLGKQVAILETKVDRNTEDIKEV